MATKKAAAPKKVVVDVSHPAHPKHSKWQIFLEALGVAIAVGPAAVQIFDPKDAALANGLGALTGAALAKAKKK